VRRDLPSIPGTPLGFFFKGKKNRVPLSQCPEVPIEHRPLAFRGGPLFSCWLPQAGRRFRIVPQSRRAKTFIFVFRAGAVSTYFNSIFSGELGSIDFPIEWRIGSTLSRKPPVLPSTIRVFRQIGGSWDCNLPGVRVFQTFAGRAGVADGLCRGLISAVQCAS